MPKRTDIKKIMLIGSGPIVIGQAYEFDYSGVQACKSLKEEGFEVVLVNSNPATIMTDPEFADRTYIEPLTVGIPTEIIRRERPDTLLPTLGGQTVLNLAIELNNAGVLERHGVEMIGANADLIRKAKDRLLFKKAMVNIGLNMPHSGSAHTLEELSAFEDEIRSVETVVNFVNDRSLLLQAKEFVTRRNPYFPFNTTRRPAPGPMIRPIYSLALEI